ncbi:MAG: hypothetical protein RL223_1150 [Pseudomonadota bacterium]|jgi:glycosyltransferase involved in cell wall biosynthesis
MTPPPISARSVLTVAIPVHQAGPVLLETVDSVLRQSLDGVDLTLDLVLIDDVSDDGAPEQAVRHAGGRLRLIRNPRRLGMVANHARCLAERDGTYLKILSQDDRLPPGSLVRQVQALRDHPQALLCCGDKAVIGPDGRRLMGVRHRLPRLIDRRTAARHAALHGTNTLGEPGAILLRCAALPPDVTFDAQDPWLLDIRLWLALLRYGPAVKVDGEVLEFRVSPRSYSVRHAEGQRESFSRLLDDLMADGSIGPTLQAWGRWRAALNGHARRLVYLRAGAR